MTIANETISWIEANLSITQGAGIGKPFQMLAWEKRFMRGAFGASGDSALTIARGNGKSTLVGAIAAACLAGPLQQRNAETLVVAASFLQGKIIFEHTLAFLESAGFDLDDRLVWRKLDNDQKSLLEHKPSGAHIRVLGSDGKRAHGRAPVLVLCDEPAQWPTGQGERMYAALTTSLGKIPGGRLIALGTRPADSTHWFQRMLDGGCSYSQNHTASSDDKPFRKTTWKKANPSLPVMPALESRIRLEANYAKKDATLLPSFEALRLNSGVSDTAENFLLEAATWREIEGVTDAEGPYVLGIDLGTSQAYSGAAAYWPGPGRLECFGVFPESPPLYERGAADGVGRLYQDCYRRDELIQSGERVSSVEGLLEEVLERWGRPALVVSDRWRYDELCQNLNKIGFPLTNVETRGQGFKDGGEDVRSFRAACLGGKVTPFPSLLMRHAMSVVRVLGDPAGNWKIGKKSEGGRKQTARDDAVAAAVIAVSAGVRHWNEKAQRETEPQAVFTAF